MSDANEWTPNAELVETIRRSIEDMLVDFRDSRISMMLCGNGLVIRERDGTDSSLIRLGTPEAVEYVLKTAVANGALVPADKAHEVAAAARMFVVRGETQDVDHLYDVLEAFYGQPILPGNDGAVST